MREGGRIPLDTECLAPGDIQGDVHTECPSAHGPTLSTLKTEY